MWRQDTCTVPLKTDKCLQTVELEEETKWSIHCMRRNVNQHTLRGSLRRSDTLVQRETLLWNLKAHLHWRFQERFQVQFRGDFKSPCKLLYKSPRNRQYFYTGDLISLFNWGSIQLVELETGISKKNLWCGKVVLNCGSSPLFNHPHVSKIRRVKPNTHTLKNVTQMCPFVGVLKLHLLWRGFLVTSVQLVPQAN